MENQQSPKQPKLSNPVLLRRRCLRSHHASSKCTKCIDACPHQALLVMDNQIAFKDFNCTGCNACVAACPAEALINVEFPEEISRAHLQRQIQEEKSVSLACTQVKTSKAAKFTCLQQVKPELLLKLVVDGAEEIKLVTADCAECARKNSEFCVEHLKQRVQQLGGAIGKEVNFRHKVKDAEVNIGRRLLFGRVIQRAEEPGTAAAPDTSKFAHEDWKRLPLYQADLIDSLKKVGANAIKNPEALAIQTPVIDPAKCSGCPLCVSACPTGALTVKKDGELLAFSVRADRCTGCNLCAEICYQKAISLQPATDVNEMTSDEEKLLNRRGLKADLYSADFEDKAREMFPGVPIYRT